MFGNLFPLSAYKPLPQCALSLPKIFEYSLYIEVKFSRQMFPCLSNLVNYWIFIHSIHYTPINSSGVQITGMLYPRALHITEILRIIWAFAKCLQFHVKGSRYRLPRQ
jgi:hypothetical protein